MPDIWEMLCTAITTWQMISVVTRTKCSKIDRVQLTVVNHVLNQSHYKIRLGTHLHCLTLPIPCYLENTVKSSTLSTQCFLFSVCMLQCTYIIKHSKIQSQNVKRKLKPTHIHVVALEYMSEWVQCTGRRRLISYLHLAVLPQGLVVVEVAGMTVENLGEETGSRPPRGHANNLYRWTEGGGITVRVVNVVRWFFVSPHFTVDQTPLRVQHVLDVFV